ncbi:MAG: metallophosphoesterase [Prevotella sp.]|nr:metallophosphoesterase [Prevotella sp.]
MIIPDVHGRTFWKGSVSNDFDHIVFLGDYLDPYGFEHITPRKAFANFEEIIAYKQEYDYRVTLLLGNHDMHYASDVFFRNACGSRYDSEMAETIKDTFLLNADLFQIAFEAEVDDVRYLFTHAGVNRSWYQRHEEMIGPLNAANLNRLALTDEGVIALAEVGRSRGGWESTGGPMWADVSEMYFAPHFSDYYQILGHSQQPEDPIIEDSFACLDCRRAFVIDEINPIPK